MPTYTVAPASGPRGLAAEGAGAVLNATNFNINLSHAGSTSAQNGTGLRAVRTGTTGMLTATDGTVTMTGNWNHGIVASGGIVDTNATVVVNGGTAPAAKLMEPSPSANRFRNSALRQSFCAPVHRSLIMLPIMGSASTP